MKNNGRAKKHPGSIYRRTSSTRLIIEYRGEKISTGLPDNKENRKVAEQMLWTLWRRDHGMEPVDQRDVVRAITTPDEAWEEYQHYLETADRAPKTITAYRDAYLKMRPVRLKPEDIDNAVQAFIRAWQGKPGSVNIHLRNYEAFLNWCVRKKYLSEIPELRAYRRRGVEKTVQVLSVDNVSRVVTVLRNYDDGDLADLVELMYHTGLRIGEAMSLARTNIVEVDGVRALRISNKVNKRPDYLPLSQKVIQILENRPIGERYFPWSKSSVSPLTKRFNKALKMAGVQGKTGFHLLRKSFRHRLQVAGVTLDAAKRLMRHSDLRVTDEHYTLYQAADLVRLLDALGNEQSVSLIEDS